MKEPGAFAALSLLADQSTPRDQRVAGLRRALEQSRSNASLNDIAQSISGFLPAGRLVPAIFEHWRPVVADSLAFFLSRLSPERLAPKLVDQFDLPTDTPLEIRLTQLIARVPALQKAGQILSRNRHLDPALRRELSELENDIRDVALSDLQVVIREGLGPLVERYEITLAPAILSEATVGAVVAFTWRHPATGKLQHGVFKVLKPGVAAYFAEDLAILESLGEYLESRRGCYAFALPDLRATFSEIRRVLQQETDFRHEQAALSEAFKIYAAMPGVRVPRLIPELSTSTITAMTEEPGIKVTNTREMSHDIRRRVANLLIDALIARPFFTPGDSALFHADPHPGNLFYDPERREIILLDWALTERLSHEERRHLALLGILTVLRDRDGIVRALCNLSRMPSAAHRQAIERRTDDLLSRRPATRLAVTADLTRLLDQLAYDGVRMPASLLIFRKVLFTLDGVLRTVAGDEVSLDFPLLRDQVARWTISRGIAAMPLTPDDWMVIRHAVLARAWRAAVDFCWQPRPLPSVQ